jgi:DNA-binding beta-propeller fold protein YncE
MYESFFDECARSLVSGSLTRRRLARGLAGVVAAVGLIHVGGDELEAKKRKKRRKGKKRKRQDGAGNPGDGSGNACPLAVCDGQCVDLNTDVNNCGACGAVCPDDAAGCVGGRCLFVSGNGQFDSPTGIATDIRGVALVADTGNERVAFLSGASFDKGADLVAPTGVAVNTASGEVYVTDPALQFGLRFAADGRLLGSFGSFGSGFGQVDTPLGAAVDPGNGRVFVVDSGNNRIQRFSATGSPLGQLGGAGSGERQFLEPEGVTIGPNREVVVADTGNNRIQMLDQAGAFIRAFGSPGSGPGQFNRPVAVTFDRDDELFVVDQGNNRIQQFTLDGQFVAAFGSAGSAPGQFNGPTGIATDEGVALLVVDTGNHRVQAFSPARTVLITTGAAARSEKDRAPGANAAHHKVKHDRSSDRAGRGAGRRSRR